MVDDAVGEVVVAVGQPGADEPEGHDYLDVLPHLAAAQGSRVDLVVAGLEVLAVLGDEGEGQSVPLGVPPVGADQEGDGGEAVSLDGLDGEEDVIAGPDVEVVDGCVIRESVPMATSGTLTKG